ncbi:hypothetical protein B0G71_7878 [Paraburkholderia sp. BL27I4N3]|nr:hypothetical protein B0G71_7878 [Paraburkholderia sp. BL27I4N3]
MARRSYVCVVGGLVHAGELILTAINIPGEASPRQGAAETEASIESALQHFLDPSESMHLLKIVDAGCRGSPGSPWQLCQAGSEIGRSWAKSVAGKLVDWAAPVLTNVWMPLSGSLPDLVGHYQQQGLQAFPGCVTPFSSGNAGDEELEVLAPSA